ncbi:hypothetical protein ACLB2K_020171 [Fragaria x ananassa]
MSEDSNEFLKFVEDGDQPLYHGCDHTTEMNFLVESFNWKTKHVLSDACYGDFLEFIKGLLPEENLVPLTVNNAKKTLSVLGMDYEKIHACPNDCILYRGEKYKEADVCPGCGVSRFKRFYQSTKTANNLTWHDWGRKKDKMMRHPADSHTWKLLDSKYPELSSDHRNLRLALSLDGFNPHSMQNSMYSCWPVILVTYNLPPWICMKRKFMMLTLLISGPKQPGNDIDVYLQPLKDDSKLLWNGIEGEVLARVEGLNYEFRKREESTPYVRIVDDQDRPWWKKKSVFFQLEYWKDIPVRHNLNVMHIEKNCCDSIIGMLLNISGKTKDGVAACLDMVAMGIKTELLPDVSGKRTLPLASLNSPTMISIYGKEMEQAHLCILQNTKDVGGFFSEHMELLKLLHPRFAKDEKWLKDKQNRPFRPG